MPHAARVLFLGIDAAEPRARLRCIERYSLEAVGPVLSGVIARVASRRSVQFRRRARVFGLDSNRFR